MLWNWHCAGLHNDASDNDSSSSPPADLLCPSMIALLWDEDELSPWLEKTLEVGPP